MEKLTNPLDLVNKNALFLPRFRGMIAKLGILCGYSPKMLCPVQARPAKPFMRIENEEIGKILLVISAFNVAQMSWDSQRVDFS